MKKYFTILSLIVLALHGSNDFSVIVKRPFNAALLDVTEDYDRSISAVGFVKQYKRDNSSHRTYTNPFDYLASVSKDNGTQTHIIKIDNSAKVIFEKSTALARFNEAVAVVKTPQNGYFIGGYTLEGSLIILKLNANGSTIFTRTFGTKNYDRMNNLILLSDGGVLAVGSSITSRATSDAMFETGLGMNDIYLTRFSKDGHKVWSKKYGTRYDDRGIDAVEASDGSIVVVSTTSYDKHRDVSLMRITENGNKVWLKHFKTERIIVPHKMIRTRDNNFVLVLSEHEALQKEQIRLIKFDLYKNVFIDKKIHTTYASALNDIKEFSDGEFIGVGYVKDTYNTDALVMILDSNLAMLSQEHYGDENYDLFNAVSILHNSQAAAVGVHTDNNSQETNMWITKLNRDGTMAPKYSDALSLYEQLSKLFAQEIKEGAVVIKEDLSIALQAPYLCFDAGAYKLTQKQKKFLKTFGVKLMGFIKQHQEHIATLEVNGHTSSEWGMSSFSQRYLSNAKLSLNRAYTTLSYIFSLQSKSDQILLTKILRGSGYSYAHTIPIGGVEDKKRSRRVDFKLILK